MKKLIIVILFISCSPSEFQKFTDESLINGRWYSPDNNETIIFDTDANTMSISGSGAIIDYKYTDNNGEFTIDGFIADNKIMAPIITAEIRINNEKSKIRLTNISSSDGELTFLVYNRLEP